MDTATLLAPLTDAPGRTSLIFDVDGTLAPIVARPGLAAVPAETKGVLARLRDRYLQVACLSGRAGGEAAALVGVEGVRYVGNHGLELHPDADRLAAQMAAFRVQIDGVWPVEDKRLSLALHYREAADESAALELLEKIAQRASERGLDPRWGRKVLEIRPRGAGDKGTGVRALLASSGARLGLYAGDDATDLDAFRGLAGAGLETAVRIAVASPEGPVDLRDAADLVVDGPPALLEVMRAL